MNDHKRITRITTLWIIILAGLMYHTVLHFVPMFYGISVEKVGATGVMPMSMVLTFGLSFIIPVVAIEVINYMRTYIGWLINQVLTVLALLVNTGHLSEFFIAEKFDPTQLFVIIPLFITNVFLVIDSWKLRKDWN